MTVGLGAGDGGFLVMAGRGSGDGGFLVEDGCGVEGRGVPPGSAVGSAGLPVAVGCGAGGWAVGGDPEPVAVGSGVAFGVVFGSSGEPVVRPAPREPDAAGDEARTAGLPEGGDARLTAFSGGSTLAREIRGTRSEAEPAVESA
ncbi:hypothetical protein ACFOWE_02535 [Planomonospora corallina]|uniref:Uncharacterized protein n=1 Tax=Planomonospora corallina TaxID=1806052 RepID=A0ABV8HZ99_9ACTN